MRSMCSIVIAVGVAVLLGLPSSLLCQVPRERDVNSSQMLDTFIFVSNPSTETWELQLPNGDYWVSLTCGDPRYLVGPHRIVLEGTTVVNDVQTAANAFTTVNNQPVTILDGFLTLEVGGAASGATMINAIVIANSPPSSSFIPVDISFQPAAAPTPSSPWIVDDGSIYSGVRGYGWDADWTSKTRQRGINADIVKDTVLFAASGSTYTWNFDVPNGMYYVSLSVGDAGYEQGPASVSVEDIYLIEDEYTQANIFYEALGEIVNVFDGNVTVKIGNASGNTMLNYVSITDVKPATVFPLKLNNQPGWAAKASGYKMELGSMYSATSGFGWEGLVKDARNRDINPSPLLDSFTYTDWYGDTATLRVDLAAGDYYLYCSCGDAQYPAGPHMVTAEPGTGNESVLVNLVSTAANEFVQVENHHVTVSDDQLNLRIGDPSPSGGPTMFNYVIINDEERQAWTEPINLQFNFQPGTMSVPGGYLKDDGGLYDVTTMHGFVNRPIARNRVGYNPDPVYASFVCTDWAGTTKDWELQIPNGTYTVGVCCGDARFLAGPHRVIAEPGGANQVTLVNNVSTAANVFVEPTPQAVTVSDGYLTLRLGGNLSGPTMLNYATITE